MLCQQCHMREANVHYKQIINGNKVEMHLCSQCAEEKGKLTFSPQLSLGSLLWGFGFGGADDAGYPGIGQQQVLRCSMCGMSFDDFRRIGKLGCPNCYRVFRDNLEPILRRLHGSTEHTGKVPARMADAIKTTNELERLKAELAAAVENEQYEKAAELRDRIRELENNNMSGGV
jgi:protein arginine kinase activator